MRRAGIDRVIGAVILLAAQAFFVTPGFGAEKAVRIGITPFQDTVLPAVATRQGWFKEAGIDVKLIDLDWADVPLALASRDIDFAIYTFDSMLPAWPRLNAAGRPLVFYVPLYVFRGAAIMVHGNAGLETVGDIKDQSENQVRTRVSRVMHQLKGKRIGITQGTTAERVVLDALAMAGMAPSDVVLVNARYSDNMTAFLARDLDAFVGGVTERLRARQAGAVELVSADAVSAPVIDGWVTTESFARQNQKVLDTATDIFFKTVRLMESDLVANAQLATEYLEGRASISYTPEQYAYAWSFQIFPQDRAAASTLFLDSGSPYYWRRIWDSNNHFLISTRKIDSPISYSWFWGEKVLQPGKPPPVPKAAAKPRSTLVEGPASGPRISDRFLHFLYNYQTLIGAFLALVVGAVTIFFLWRQIGQQRQQQAETALALCRMFHEEVKLFARFFCEVDFSFRAALRAQSAQAIASLHYPDKVVFDSQVTRLSEINHRVALSLMYFYQALLYLENSTSKNRLAISDPEAQSLQEAYDHTLANLTEALERSIEYLENRDVPVEPQDKQLLEKVRPLMSA
jgi:ABC-type nitrate/sulfonate/bicarbonate transport system substrate-binding protein